MILSDWPMLRARRLTSDRRGAVALWVAMIAPVLSAALGLGIEVSRWSAVQVDMQRAADIASIAGAVYYNKNTGAANLAQNTATYAAHLAEMNGITGTASPTWTAGTNSLADNQATVQITSGILSASDTAVKVTVRQSVPVVLSGLFSSLTSVTVPASSWSEIVSTTTTTGPQPCILALGGDGTGITTDTDITLTGSININASGCSIRSDGKISITGSATITTGGVYAGGAITTTGSITINGPKYPDAGQIPDPYLGDATLQSALTAANSATGPTITCTASSRCTGSGVSCSGGSCVLQPGSYSGISVTGSTVLTLNPGLYTVNGNISFTGSSTVSGSDVTILMGAGTGGTSHQFTTAGSTVLGLTAATTSTETGCTTNCAIPGILFASQSTAGSSFTGSSGIPFTGLVYYPNGSLSFTGSSVDGSTGCAEVIATSIRLTGSADLSSGCTAYGTLTFGSATTTTALVSLVQ